MIAHLLDGPFAGGPLDFGQLRAESLKALTFLQVLTPSIPVLIGDEAVDVVLRLHVYRLDRIARDEIAKQDAAFFKCAGANTMSLRVPLEPPAMQLAGAIE